MRQVVTNSTVNGILQAIFALFVIVIVLNALYVWVKALRAGGLPNRHHVQRLSRGFAISAIRAGPNRSPRSSLRPGRNRLLWPAWRPGHGRE